MYGIRHSCTVFKAFAGGPLSSKTGNELIAQGVNLYPWYGGTEFGPHTRVFDIDDSPNPDPNAKTKEDWEWLSFSNRVNCRWVPEGDGTFELQYLVSPTGCSSVIKMFMCGLETCETHRPNVENLEDTRGYATSDLWVPHPTKKGLWRMSVDSIRPTISHQANLDMYTELDVRTM